MSVQDEVDNIFRRSREGPSGPNGPSGPSFSLGWSWWWSLVPLALLFFWGSFSCFYTVQPEETAVVKRFGAFIGETGPGLHFKLPFGIDRAYIVPTERVLKEEFGFRTEALDERGTSYETGGNLETESLTLTGDLNIIKVEWVVQYRVENAYKWLHKIREPEETLRDVSESVMRQIVGNRWGSDVLTVGRVEIAADAREEIQRTMDGYDSGARIITVELQDVLPTKRVQPAFNEVNIARQERERMINEAEKRRNQVVPKVKGQANQLIQEAEGYAAARVNYARGEVVRFSEILEQYKLAPEVTRRRMYLETMNKALGDAERVVVVQGGQSNPLPLLNLDKTATKGAL